MTLEERIIVLENMIKELQKQVNAWRNDYEREYQRFYSTAACITRLKNDLSYIKLCDELRPQLRCVQTGELANLDDF